MTAPPVDAWLRGPVPGIPPVLQPAAHALIQVREDVRRVAAGLAPGGLHARPGGSASIAFHLMHLANATDRLLTYARGEKLSDTQRAALREEREGVQPSRDAESLVRWVEEGVDRALAQLAATREADLLEPRAVGAGGIPSTVIGLLFHAAEHAGRHAGQVSTLAKAVGHAPGTG
jgi:uncharacterized damage-inducible protein DinB